MNREGAAWPGYNRIAEEAGVSVRAVQNAVRALVDGDPSRELLPLFTRKRRLGERGKPLSYEYRLVQDPKALVQGREKATARLTTITAVLTGVARDKAIEVDATTKAAAEELRRRKLDLQAQLLRDGITENEFRRQEKALETQGVMLARAVDKGPTRGKT